MLIHGVEMIEAGDMVFRHQSQTGKTFEARSIRAWKEAATGLAIDIGAYTGLYSLVAAKAGASVIAFEPNPKVYARLLENAAANNVSIEARQLGVSDYDGGGKLVANPKVPLTSAGRIEAGDDVQVIRIDSLSLAPVSAIKIDTEGHECAVIRGAYETIARDLPLIITEALDEAAFKQQLALLLPLGYRAAPADQWNILWRT